MSLSFYRNFLLFLILTLFPFFSLRLISMFDLRSLITSSAQYLVNFLPALFVNFLKIGQVKLEHSVLNDEAEHILKVGPGQDLLSVQGADQGCFV